MKAIKTQAIIEGIRSRKDGSLGLSVSTPELSFEEKAMFMELQGVNVGLLVEPSDEEKIEVHQVDADINHKSQSQRIRAILFILWKQNSEGTDFESYYMKKTEQIIEILKAKIENFNYA